MRRQERRIEGNMDWKRRTDEYSIRICKHRQVLNEFWRIRGFRRELKIGRGERIIRRMGRRGRRIEYRNRNRRRGEYNI
jgi:hypothetical protein